MTVHASGADRGPAGRVLALARSPRTAPALVALFCIIALLLLVALRPWRKLEFSTWPVGFEAARIARNLTLGLGYESPFLALEGDNFLFYRTHHDEFTAGVRAPVVEAPVPGAHPTAWITPPHVLLWYVLFRLFGTYSPASVAVFYVVQILTMAAAFLMAARIVAARRGPAAASVAMAAAILYPPTWYFALEGSNGTVLFLALLLAGFLALGRLLAGGGPAWRLAFALSVALALLAEPAALLFYAWIVPWAALRLARGERVRLLAATVLCCAVVWGPWAARNLAVLGRPIVFKSNLPMEMMYGNNPDALDDALLAHMHRFPAWSDTERQRLLQMGEAAYADDALRRALGFIRERPIDFLDLTLRRISWYWSYMPYRATPWRPLWTVFFHAVVALWIVSMMILGRRGLDWFDRACIGFALLFPVAYYVTHFMIYRYRFPMELLMILAAASAVGRVAPLGAGAAEPGGTSAPAAAGSGGAPAPAAAEPGWRARPGRAGIQ
jgi:hypothetical protein